MIATIMFVEKEVLQKIRDNIDLVDFLEKRGITLKKVGTSWVGLCPFHNERTPSFNIKPSTKTFRCFGCGIFGDIFTLTQELETLTFVGAVQMLAEISGTPLNLETDPDYKYRQRLYALTKTASELFRTQYLNLPTNHPGKQNLAVRELLNYSLTDKTIGFTTEGTLIPYLHKKGYTNTEIVDAGLAGTNETKKIFERFRNRLSWTLTDTQGRPVGFSARIVTPTPNTGKYVNTPQTKIFNKSKTLLGLSETKKLITQQQTVYVTEGQTDVMALKAAGKLNTVASCGTAFSPQHANLLLNLFTLGKNVNKYKIVFCFDGDDAGIEAAKKIFTTCPDIQLNSYVVKFLNPDGTPTDPCDYRKNFGDNQLNTHIDTTQITLAEFIVNETFKEWDTTTPEGKSGYITHISPILKKIRDPIQHSFYLKQISARTGLSTAELYAPPPAPPAVAKEGAKFSFDDTHEIRVLAATIQHPTIIAPLIAKYHIDETFFPTYQTLAKQILHNMGTSSPSYDPFIIELTHFPLPVVRGGEGQYSLNLIKSYLKHQFVLETQKLDKELANTDQQNMMNVFLENQQKHSVLQKKYSQHVS